jgi:hypothetical protein
VKASRRSVTRENGGVQGAEGVAVTAAAYALYRRVHLQCVQRRGGAVVPLRRARAAACAPWGRSAPALSARRAGDAAVARVAGGCTAPAAAHRTAWRATPAPQRAPSAA